MGYKDYLDDAFFHGEIKKIYKGNDQLNKKHEDMAKVTYTPAHLNTDYPENDIRRGKGKDHAVWVYSEEPDTAEGIFDNGLELFMDAFFEAGAAVGLHTHHSTDEIYYIISGEIEMTTVNNDGSEKTVLIREGDSHAVTAGSSHYGVAGKKGCRAIVIALKSNKKTF